MTRTETKLRAGLRAVAEETAAGITPPPIAAISLAAQAAPSKRARWPKIAIAVVAAATLGTGVAAAIGRLPGPISDKLEEFRERGYDVDDEAARRVASTSAGGTTYELWTAQSDRGYCTYVRVVGPEGDVERGGASHCVPDAPLPSSLWYLGVPERTDPRQPIPIAGHLPLGATKLVIAFEDGTTHEAAAEAGGYFMTVLPREPDSRRLVELRAVTPDGAVVAAAPVGNFK